MSGVKRRACQDWAPERKRRAEFAGRQLCGQAEQTARHSTWLYWRPPIGDYRRRNSNVSCNTVAHAVQRQKSRERNRAPRFVPTSSLLELQLTAHTHTFRGRVTALVVRSLRLVGAIKQFQP